MFGESGIYRKLKDDHEEVSKMMDEISGLDEKQSARRRQLFEKVQRELLAHAEAEAQTFYATLRKHDESREAALEGEEEHKVVKRLLSEIAQMNADGERWMAKFTVLKENVEHHVEEEESEIFSKAKKVLSDDDSEDLAQAFEAEKKRRRSG